MSDIWRLPMVRQAYKNGKKTYIMVSDDKKKEPLIITDGDVITYDKASGDWSVILTTESYKRNK